MKSTMPYFGCSSAVVTATCREVFASYDTEDFATWEADVLELWRNAKYREERYAAINLSGIRRATAFWTLAALPMYEEMITTGAWWDYVDTIATHRITPLLEAYPAPMKKTMLAWSKSPDMWKARTSIICQVPRKAKTDLKLLYACIEPSLGSREFFLRKAIGWALRQYAWTDPNEIIAYVKAHDAELSGLSKREALKNV